MKNENKSKIQINISQDDSENNDFYTVGICLIHAK
jgi:hypothetical protein